MREGDSSGSVKSERRGQEEVCFPPQGPFPSWMTHAGHTKQTSDVKPFPTRPVCLHGQGLQATQVVSSLCGERSTCPVGGAPHAHLIRAAG